MSHPTPTDAQGLQRRLPAIARSEIEKLKLEGVVGMGLDSFFSRLASTREVQRDGPRGVNCRWVLHNMLEEVCRKNPDIDAFILKD